MPQRIKLISEADSAGITKRSIKEKPLKKASNMLKLVVTEMESKHFSIIIRFENLFNERYSEQYSFVETKKICCGCEIRILLYPCSRDDATSINPSKHLRSKCDFGDLLCIYYKFYSTFGVFKQFLFETTLNINMF